MLPAANFNLGKETWQTHVQTGTIKLLGRLVLMEELRAEEKFGLCLDYRWTRHRRAKRRKYLECDTCMYLIYKKYDAFLFVKKAVLNYLCSIHRVANYSLKIHK